MIKMDNSKNQGWVICLTWNFGIIALPCEIQGNIITSLLLPNHLNGKFLIFKTIGVLSSHKITPADYYLNKLSVGNYYYNPTDGLDTIISDVNVDVDEMMLKRAIQRYLLFVRAA